VLAKRYGAKEILMGIVTLGKAESDEPTSILLRRLMPNDSRVEEISLKSSAKQTDAARIAAAADLIARYASGLSASVAEAQRDAWMKLPAREVQINFTTIAEFGTIEGLLQSAPGVAHVDFPQIALQHVEGKIYIDGSDKKIRKYLHKNSVRMQEIGDRWILSLR
jgi:hypothetical protein